jgi:uncharacterized protein YeaO (DUF488 family)
MQIHTGRLGDPFPPGVYRVLVDRLWPRGVRREEAPWDVWLRDVAPSADLRKWYHAHPQERETFVARYRQELSSPAWQAPLEELVRLARQRPVALLTAARDPSQGQVPVLAEVLRERLQQSPQA